MYEKTILYTPQTREQSKTINICLYRTRLRNKMKFADEKRQLIKHPSVGVVNIAIVCNTEGAKNTPKTCEPVMLAKRMIY